jgi:hypothetical protein
MLKGRRSRNPKSGVSQETVHGGGPNHNVPFETTEEKEELIEVDHR